MRGLLWLLALCAVAVGVSLAARVNDGYLLLIVPPYRIEIALSLAIILFFSITLIAVLSMTMTAAVTTAKRICGRP